MLMYQGPDWTTGNRNATEYPNQNSNFNASAEPVRPRSSASARNSKVGSCLAYTAGAAHVRSILDPSHVAQRPLVVMQGR